MIKISLQYFCLLVILQERNITSAKTFVNKALNKTTNQSGTLEYPKPNNIWSSQHAVDGRKNCPTGDSWQEYSGTAAQDTPWWQVDLGKVFTIDHVIVYGRPGSTSLQFKGFRLYISTKNAGTSADIAYENKDDKFIVNIDTQNQQGRFVTIDLPKSQYNNRKNTGPLVLCEVEIFAPVSEIARFATVEVSSVLNYGGFDYNKDNVIDNRTTSSNIDTCSCCWASMDEQNPFIQLTLPTSQSFDSVIIIGRSDRQGNDDSTTLAGIIVFTDGRPVDPNLIHSNVSSNTATIQLQSIDTKTINVSRPYTGTLNKWFLIICEIYIYIDDAKCPPGSFGYFCENMCGQCLESSCDSETRQCTSGCQPGYMNEFCNQTCTPHHYGNCSQKCGHCRDNSNCNHVNGSCPNGCAPGYKPGNTLCNDECDTGYFGDDCLNPCSQHCFNGDSKCDKVTGACMDGCEPGYMGFNCTTQCEDGRYGRNCNESCGYCISNQHCNKYNGSCLNGCEPGYEGDLCKSACKDGKYGHSCKDFCHCQNDTACNKSNGQCSSGCDVMWTGENCSKSNNLINSIINNVITTQMGAFNNASKAIDGVDNCINASYGCCSVAQKAINETQLTWWEIDLGQKYLIDAVSIFGRYDGLSKEQIQGAVVYAGNESLSTSSSSGLQIITVPNDINSLFHFGGQLDTQIIAQFFIVRINNTILSLCEFLLRKKECSSGLFGIGCLHICHCKENTKCDSVTGHCPVSQCDPGWQSEACDKECSENKFGENCSSTCFCKEDTCNPINGTCIMPLAGCKQGYQGETCAEPRKEEQTLQNSSNIAGAAGGASAAVIALVVAVIVGFFVYRRHKSKSGDQHASNTFSHLEEALRQSQQRRVKTQSTVTRSGSDNSAYRASNVEDDNATTVEGVAGDAGGGYYDFAEIVGIRIHELWDYIHENFKNECEKLYNEFKKLPSGLIHPCASADHIANRGKNRYREMYAYDHTRVILEEKNDKGTDYVNANYIDGYNMTRKFVACQGPTKQMIDDFWKMVWQLKSDKIVMLTNLVEMGATKCVLYWPKKEEFCYGKVNVKIVKVDTDLDFDVRHLDVWKEGESPRRIRQYHFKSWPDKDVPDSTWCLLKFWRAVQTDAESKARPIIVHCSAGVGRTGTFIALDNLIHQARDEGCVRPFQVVQTLRGQRVNMVQTKEQYVYLHEVLADALSFGTHFVWSTQFEAVYMSLLQKENGEAKTRLEVQYDLIQKSLKNTESMEAEAPEYSNMETIISESDAYRPKLKKRGSKFVQQLGATFIPNYDGRNTFLVAMSPDKSTIEEFWSLVDDLNIKTVIMLTEKSSTCYKTSCELGAQADNTTKFHVNKIKEKSGKGHTERSFTFKGPHGEEDDQLVTIKQFEYTAWKDGYVVPGDAHSLIDFLEAVLKWQPHVSESQPVLIYDSDGCSRSGILCVALNEVQRIKTEGGHINIVQSVKTMKQRKPQLIHSFEQYKFCYELISAYLKHTEVYQNLK